MTQETVSHTKIVLSGLAGAGKSSIGKALANKLGIPFRSIGNFARQEAEKRGITIQELQIQLIDEPETDKQFDQDLINWCKAHENWIVDYRLGCALLPGSISIYLTVDDEEAARRIAAANRSEEFTGNESAQETLNSIRERNENMRTRLKGIYGVDFTDRNQYDHVLPTDDKSVDELIDLIIQLLSID